MSISVKDIISRRKDGAFRSATIGTINEDARTVELTFSSEAEVPRWYGIETLSHDQGAVSMDRLRSGAPLLMEHGSRDQVGVVEAAWIGDDRRGHARVRFSRSARAQDVFQDVIDGIRKNVSVGYRILDMKLSGSRDGEDIYTATRWEPYEVSIVAVPADQSVGIGRSARVPAQPNDPTTPENRGMSEATSPQAATPHAPHIGQTAAQTTSQTELTQAERSGADGERQRVRAIVEMGEKFGATDLVRSAVAEGVSVADFQTKLLESLNARSAQMPLSEKGGSAAIGLTDREARKFSLVRVLRALSEPTNRRAAEEAAFEFEASRAAAETLGKNTDHFVIPQDVLTRSLNTAADGAAPGNTGGMSIATNLLAGSFIDILRNRATIMKMGSVIGGLVGNIDIPRQVAAAQGYWLGEDEDATQSNLELGQISMTPRTVAGYSEITRKLLVQSSLDIEALVQSDLAKALALTIDKAGYYGTGADKQPLGIKNQTGIHAVSFAADQPTYAELVQMETAIAMDNADVSSMAYVGNAAFRGHCKTTRKFPDAVDGGVIWEQGGTVNGYSAQITNQIASGDVFMGNFGDLLVGLWGGLELLVDPYSNSTKGRLRVVMFQDVDFVLRRTQSFTYGVKTPSGSGQQTTNPPSGS